MDDRKYRMTCQKQKRLQLAAEDTLKDTVNANEYIQKYEDRVRAELETKELKNSLCINETEANNKAMVIKNKIY